MRSSVTFSLSATFLYWLTQILSLTSPVRGLYVLTRYENNPFNDQFFIDNGDQLPSPIDQKDGSDRFAAQFEAPGKRSASAMKPLPAHEHVCNTKILRNYQPTHGHEQNGSKVEIQQDAQRSFSATFVECENNERSECHGIDNILFTSECVTLYEFRQAGVRPAGSDGPFTLGLVKVPITCQCRLRRKGSHIVIGQ